MLFITNILYSFSNSFFDFYSYKIILSSGNIRKNEAKSFASKYATFGNILHGTKQKNILNSSWECTVWTWNEL